MNQSSIEIRCPFGPQRLFMKLVLYDEIKEETSIPDYLDMEFACSDCARFYRKDHKNVYRVLHRYSIVGEYRETEIIES